MARADGTVVCARCHLADSFFPRLRGLLGRRAVLLGLGGYYVARVSAAPVETYAASLPADSHQVRARARQDW